MSGQPQALKFAGYAALFGKADGARDTIIPGAFARSLSERTTDLPLYWQHKPEKQIGWVSVAREDRRGLQVIATITNPHSRAAELLRRKKVSGLSFGYRARGFRRTPVGRELSEIELFEISLVTHPLHHDARVHLISE
ncbi:HK97 family phage prohead protease [Erythrobacter sp. W53]|uniref:HK97 family phage prohead protease n=1 Tax=Erythrobacter sp. W53 TaxID=3425947 RepID=UPI003D767B99